MGNLRTKPRAFEPSPKTRQTSVFWVGGLSDSEVWDHGDQFVGRVRKKPILARATVTVRAVEAVGLQADFDNDPPRHANIVGWPESKHETKSRAQELAAEATLVVREQSSALGP